MLAFGTTSPLLSIAAGKTLPEPSVNCICANWPAVTPLEVVPINSLPFVPAVPLKAPVQLVTFKIVVLVQDAPLLVANLRLWVVVVPRSIVAFAANVNAPRLIWAVDVSPVVVRLPPLSVTGHDDMFVVVVSRGLNRISPPLMVSPPESVLALLVKVNVPEPLLINAPAPVITLVWVETVPVLP